MNTITQPCPQPLLFACAYLTPIRNLLSIDEKVSKPPSHRISHDLSFIPEVPPRKVTNSCSYGFGLRCRLLPSHSSVVPVPITPPPEERFQTRTTALFSTRDLLLGKSFSLIVSWLTRTGNSRRKRMKLHRENGTQAIRRKKQSSLKPTRKLWSWRVLELVESFTSRLIHITYSVQQHYTGNNFLKT